MKDDLESLIARIADLEQRHTEVAAENRRLRAEFAELKRETETLPRSVSRRGLLRAGAGAVAAGAGAIVVGAAPAAATTGAMQFGTTNDAGTDTTTLTASALTGTLRLIAENNGSALVAESAGQYGITATGTTSIGTLLVEHHGSPFAAVLVKHHGPAGPAVVAEISSPTNRDPVALVVHEGAGMAAGFVNGENALSPTCGIRTLGSVNSLELEQAGGLGHAIFAVAHSESNSRSVIYAETSSTGAAIEGRADAGRGASFRGGIAQIRLVPSAASTHPETGVRGDLFCDKFGRLWYCKGATNWKQLA